MELLLSYLLLLVAIFPAVSSVRHRKSFRYSFYVHPAENFFRHVRQWEIPLFRTFCHCHKFYVLSLLPALKCSICAITAFNASALALSFLLPLFVIRIGILPCTPFGPTRVSVLSIHPRCRIHRASWKIRLLQNRKKKDVISFCILQQILHRK